MKFLSYMRGEAFQRGIHPPQHKLTAEQPIKRLPFAPKLTVPLSQHIGQPAHAVVRVGQEVARGQVIAEADGWLSVPTSFQSGIDGCLKRIRTATTSPPPAPPL